MSRQRLSRLEATSNIPALRRSDHSWVRCPDEKANLLREGFSNKWFLPEPVVNEYSPQAYAACIQPFVPIRIGRIRKSLAQLRDDSATSPDLLPARVLKCMAEVLVYPIALRCRRILQQGRWPTMWCLHWVCLLFKKRSVFDPSNYRGLQITSQLSKLVERIIGGMCLPRLLTDRLFGENRHSQTQRS